MFRRAKLAFRILHRRKRRSPSFRKEVGRRGYRFYRTEEKQKENHPLYPSGARYLTMRYVLRTRYTLGAICFAERNETRTFHHLTVVPLPPASGRTARLSLLSNWRITARELPFIPFGCDIPTVRYVSQSETRLRPPTIQPKRFIYKLTA